MSDRSTNDEERWSSDQDDSGDADANNYAADAADAGEAEESDTTDATPALTDPDAGRMIVVGEGVCMEDLKDENEECKPRDEYAVNKTEEDEGGEEKIEALPPFFPEDAKLPAAAYVPDTKYVLSGSRPPPREEESGTFNCKCWQCQRGEGHHGASSMDQQIQQPSSSDKVVEPNARSPSRAGDASAHNKGAPPSLASKVPKMSGEATLASLDDVGDNDECVSVSTGRARFAYAPAQANPQGHGDGNGAPPRSATPPVDEEALTGLGHGSYHQQSLPGAFSVPGLNEARSNIEEYVNDHPEDRFYWETLPGAFNMRIPIAPEPPIRNPSIVEDNSNHHAVLDAHVAPSEEEMAARMEQRRNNSICEHIRERLFRNAPLVEATIAHDEENGFSGGSGGPDNSVGNANSTSGSTQAEDLNHSSRQIGGTRDPSPTNQGFWWQQWRRRSSFSDAQVPHANEDRPGNHTKMHSCVEDRSRWQMATALFAAAAALVLGLSIPLSRRPTAHNSENEQSQPTPPGDQDSPPSPPGNFPPFPPVSNATLVPSSSPTALPSSSPLEVADTTEWKTMGSPITGLRNESGVTIHIDYSTGGVTFGYGSRSNMTFSGMSVSLTDDGQTLAVGELGTDTVRVFQWDAEKDDWVQKGQTLRGARDCSESYYPDDPTQFLPCYLAFGFIVEISGDGSALVVSALGHHHQTGMVQVYKWDEQLPGAWVRHGSDFVGKERNQGFGAMVRFAKHGETLAIVSSQSAQPDFAAEMGIEAFNIGPGLVEVFDWNGTAWDQRGDTIYGKSIEESLGFVDLTEDGQSMVLGTILGGYAEVYDWDASLRTWILRGESIDAPIGEENFGSPALFASQDGNRLVIGSNYDGDDETEGAYLLYVFGWDGNGWIKLDRMNILQSSAQSRSNRNAVVTNDGSILAAAYSAGVQIYEWNGFTYVPKGDTVDGGREVAISNDGEIFAVGRPNDHSLGLGLGRTTVYGTV